MEKYRLTMQHGLTIVEQLDNPFKMSICKQGQQPGNTGTAIMEGLLYREEKVFVRNGSYFFEALNHDGKPLNDDVDLEQFRRAVAFFFSGILNTDHYLISIPKTSCLCNVEMRKFEFD